MKKSSFVEGTLIATLAIVFVKILGMLYVIPFYSIVGSSGAALYSYAYNIYLIFLGISSAGLPNAISKVISEYNTLGMFDAKERAYKNAIKIISFISIIAFLFLFILAEEIGTFIIGNLEGGNTAEDVAFVIRCVAPAVLVIPYLSITKGYLQGHKYVTPSSVSQLIEQIVRIAVILIGSYVVLKVLNGELKVAIGIAVMGALFGGIAAIIYLKWVTNKNKDKLVNNTLKKDDISNKEITLKIIKYAIPFIIINIVTNVYTFTDQILVLRTLEYLGMDANTVEFVASSISTWSPKICMVINAMAMGMTISLIPAIVSSYTEHNWSEVERKINQSISMVTYISLPLVLGLIILAVPVWRVFYGYSLVGASILRLAVISAMLANIYMVISTIVQSLNKFKLVYTVSIVGFVLNAVLDVPMMLLFNKIGIPAYLGSIVSSMIGFTSSILIGLISLKKSDNIKYNKMFKNLGKMMIPAITMTVVLIIINSFIKLDLTSTINSIILIAIDAIIGGIIYIGISYKTNLLYDILGRDQVNKILKKLTFGKFQG
jgi:O-antigen/teichoic acid export membrane protein